MYGHSEHAGIEIEEHMRLDRRLELRTSTDDLTRWQTAARGSGYHAVADWIRTSLNREAAFLPGGGESAERRDRPVFGKSTFENGVRIVTESFPGASAIAVGVFVDCGWRDEHPEEAGLAQLCQRMLFKGTSSRDAGQIAQEADSAGGRLSGYTGRDYTCVSALVPSDKRYQLMDLLGDIFMNSTFPPEHLEREQLWIGQQLAGSMDLPAVQCTERMKAEAWGGASSYGIPEVAAAGRRHSREDAIYFLETHYSPNRIIVAAAGDLEHEDFVAQARDSYWRLIGESDAAPLVKPEFREGVSIVTTAAGQSYFSLGFEAPGCAHSGRMGIEILTSILGGGTSSRLLRAIGAVPDMVCEVSAEHEAFREAGMLVVNGRIAPENLAKCIGKVMEAIAALASWREPVTAKELELAKERVRASHQLEAQGPATRMQRIGTQELYFGRHLSLQQRLAEIDGIDLNMLRRLISGEWRAALRRPCISVLSPELESGWESRLRRSIRTECDAEFRVFEVEARIA